MKRLFDSQTIRSVISLLSRHRFAAIGLGFLFLAAVSYVALTGSSTRYLTAPVQRGDIVSLVTATGTITPVGQVNVSSQLSGRIAEVLVDFNDEVVQGQVLARLDPEGFRAAVRQAEAAVDIAQANLLMQEAALSRAESGLETARATRRVGTAETDSVRAQREEAERELERVRALAEEAIVSGSALDRAEAQAATASALLRAAETQELVGDAATAGAEAEVKMAVARLQNAVAEVKRSEAVLDRARVDLERSTIRSPIDGVVIGRNIDQGQTVAASLEAPDLFTLASDLRDTEVIAQVDQADIGRVAVGQGASFTVDAYPNQEFTGTITQIRKSPLIVQNVVTYSVVISAKNPHQQLLPGMTALLRITVAEVRDVVKIPNAALRYRPSDDIAAPVEAAAAAGELELPQPGYPAIVWSLRNGRLEPRVIGIGPGSAAESVVLSGDLGEDDLVVVGAEAAADSRLGVRVGF